MVTESPNGIEKPLKLLKNMLKIFGKWSGMRTDGKSEYIDSLIDGLANLVRHRFYLQPNSPGFLDGARLEASQRPRRFPSSADQCVASTRFCKLCCRLRHICFNQILRLYPFLSFMMGTCVDINGGILFS